MADSALEHCKSLNKDPEDFGMELHDALDACGSIYDSLEPKRQKDSPFLVWSHVDHLAYKIKNDDLPEVRRGPVQRNRQVPEAADQVCLG